jgi:hypothetical protein
VALGHAFDQETIDSLLFLDNAESQTLLLSGDGVLRFMRVVASGLATFSRKDKVSFNTGGAVHSFERDYYTVSLTSRGRLLVDAWKSGDREAVRRALSGPIDSPESPEDE